MRAPRHPSRRSSRRGPRRHLGRPASASRVTAAPLTSVLLVVAALLQACGGGSGGGARGGPARDDGGGFGPVGGGSGDGPGDGQAGEPTIDTDGDGTPDTFAPGPNGSWLFVSGPRFYFGTRDVGTVATQEIELVNRGADIYPIRTVAVTGENAEEFSSDLRGPVTLKPSEAVRVHVSFAPIDEGRKYANLDIDFDTVTVGGAEAGRVEQAFYRARDLEDHGRYVASARGYADYVASDPVTVNERRAAIKLPVVREAELYGEDGDAALYLSAMNAREAGDLEAATQELDTLLLLHPDGYLADDALYLKAYVDLIDRKDHAAALGSLRDLRSRYPDTTYYDTALYGEALAQQGLGNDALARSIYLDLRHRHTGIDALGVRLPKDDLVSRLWFDRANTGLASLDRG